MTYDLQSMAFDAERAREWLERDLLAVESGFHWKASPQGYDWWAPRWRDGLDEPARAALREMLAQWGAEKGVGISDALEMIAQAAVDFGEYAMGCISDAQDAAPNTPARDISHVGHEIDGYVYPLGGRTVHLSQSRIEVGRSSGAAPGRGMLGCEDGAEALRMPSAYISVPSYTSNGTGGCVVARQTVSGDTRLTAETAFDKIARGMREAVDIVAGRSDPARVAPPTPDAWIPWHGGECPVAPETVVETKQRGKGGIYGAVPARIFFWDHRDCTGDITAYRVVSPATPDPAASHEAVIAEIAAEKSTRTRTEAPPATEAVEVPAYSPETSQALARSFAVSRERGLKWGAL